MLFDTAKNNICAVFPENAYGSPIFLAPGGVWAYTENTGRFTSRADAAGSAGRPVLRR